MRNIRWDAMRRFRWPTVAAAALLVGCASSLPVYETARAPDEPHSPGTAAADPVGSQVVQTALAMLGTPYRYGGASPRGFDCSGLVQYAYQQAGIAVPRTTEQQFRAARRIHRTDARPGDLLFFSFTHTVSHVAIYLGEGRFVHAPTRGRSVEIISLDHPYYRAGFVGAGRLATRT